MPNSLKKIMNSLPRVQVMNGRNSKYGNIPTEVDGINFHSKSESLRYTALRGREDCGAIKNLRWQVPFELHMEGKRFCKYVADFVYEKDGITVVEDVKSPALMEEGGLFSLKKRCMKIEYDIDVVCIDPNWVLAC